MTGTKRSASDSVAEEKAPAEKKKKETEKQEIAPLTFSSSSSSSSASSETITTLSTKNEGAPTWFQKDRIHAYEIEFCPHFFSHTRLTKTPALYQMIRNEIISIYEKDPKTFLTITSLRQNMLGDVCSIMKIYDFLNTHNIINYDVSHSQCVRTSMINEVLPFTSYENQDEAGKIVKSLQSQKEKDNSTIENIYDMFDKEGNPKVAMEEIKKAAKEKAVELKALLNKQVGEYMELRHKVLDEKLKLLEHVEKGLAIEYNNLETTRRDNQVSRAYLAYMNNLAL